MGTLFLSVLYLVSNFFFTKGVINPPPPMESIPSTCIHAFDFGGDFETSVKPEAFCGRKSV